MCKKAKKYGSLNRKGGVGPPDGVVVGWGMVGYGFEVSSVGCLSTGRQHQPRRTRGIGARGHGLNLIYRTRCAGLLPWGIGCAILLISSACFLRRPTKTAGGWPYSSRSVASEV